MEINPAWIIIVGLGIDIVGVLLIIGPIRQTRQLSKTLFEKIKEIDEDIKKRREGKDEISPLSNRKEIDRLTHYVYDKIISELAAYKKVMIGVGLLVLGFILQIIGNYYQSF